MRTQRAAFTLIELLIVVAIIAILAAIAVPNFLEAQTRAKVSKVYADFRSTGVAIESYAVDNGHYPSCLGPNGDYAQGYANRLHRITTPIAYIKDVPDDDPFKGAGSHTGQAYFTNGEGSYEYFEQDGVAVRGGGDEVLACTAFQLCGGMKPFAPLPHGDPNIPFFTGPKWLCVCAGPDKNEPWQLVGVVYPGGSVGWFQAVVFYDPTNGTVSYGDIYKSQALSSFQ